MYVIFGASGNAGSVTAAALRKAGQRVRAVVRDAQRAGALAALGCEIVVADLTDLQSVRAAIEGAEAVQILCPVPARATDPESAMRNMIDVAAGALCAAQPPHVLALSDYGAELATGTGITRLFHYLEARLHPLGGRLTLLRSAEHMENWARVIPLALRKGLLPSLHHPLTKQFPCVCARDAGAIAAELLLDATGDAAARRAAEPRIVSVEGPARVSAIDVANTLGEIVGKDINAIALPRNDWTPTLRAAGLSENHVRLVTDLYDAHNAGKIDVEAGKTERRYGTTTLREVIASLVPDSLNAPPH
jgi:uncharacterized protein YbjT (DUF2867 family)